MAILAGGKSSRLGANKAFLELGSQTFIQRVLNAANPLAAECMLIANNPEAFSALKLPTHTDQQAGLGPVGGLYTALARANHPLLLLLACDLPFMSTPFLRFLLSRAGNHQIVIPETKEGLQPLCAVYAASCLPAVERAIEARRLHMTSFHDQVDVHVLKESTWRQVEPDDRLFLNVNTRADYERALVAFGDGRG